MNKVIMLMVLPCLFIAAPAEASLTITSPASVCSLLNDIGFATRGWRNLYDNKFGCSSPYKNIGTGFPLPNNLAYYVIGDRNSVTLAKLALNVNNKSQATSAKSALLSVSETLSIKLAGAKLTKTVKNAIMEGKPMKTKLGQTGVKVTRDNWPTGKGYELRVIFK